MYVCMCQLLSTLNVEHSMNAFKTLLSHFNNFVKTYKASQFNVFAVVTPVLALGVNSGEPTYKKLSFQSHLGKTFEKVENFQPVSCALLKTILFGKLLVFVISLLKIFFTSLLYPYRGGSNDKK